ncbi:hypothetical protein [Streptomyces sp. NPDC020489]|uniref:hypothetical protein n=1 Tax=Streptomyces sp. NPDC020489 TaxID=3365077 RepID=UPI0037991E6B
MAIATMLSALRSPLSALDLAIPALLALTLLKGRLNRRHTAGLACAALAIGLIALR